MNSLRRACFGTISFVLWGLIAVYDLSAQGLTASDLVLAFGKERSVRASIPAAASPAFSTITSPSALIWDLPSVGNIYAAVAVGGISVGQILTAQNIAGYGCQTSVDYEAPNHPYIIQSISEGGVVAVSGTVCGSTPPAKLSVRMEYGRERITIAVGTPDGKIILGAPTPITFTIPASLPAAVLRVDFGVAVQEGGRVGRVLDFAPPPAAPVLVTYPSNYSESVSIEAVATTGSFLVADPQQAGGSGLQADGATLSGKNSFQAVKPPRADLTQGDISVVKSVDRTLVRRDGQVTYTFRVTNNSQVAITNVSVWDNQLGEIQTIPTLGPGATVPVTPPAVTLTSTTKNYALVSGTDPFGNKVDGRSNEISVRVIDPALRLNVWAQPLETKAGKEVIYHYDVSNVGDVLLTNITVTDDQFGAVGNVASLDVGDERNLTLRVTHPAGSTGTISNTGRATATVPDDGGQVTAEDGEQVTILAPRIQVTITADRTKVKAGDKVTYTITVTNTGELELNAAVTGNLLGNIGQANGLAPGASQVFTQDEIVQSSRTHIVNAIGVDSWNDQTNAQANVTVDVIYPALKVSVTANGQAMKATVNKGDQVKFVHVVENIGDCELKNVVVRGGGTSVLTIPTLAPGASGQGDQTLTIDSDTQHTANASGEDPNGASVKAAPAQVLVEVSRGLLGGLQDLMGNGNRLMAAIEQYRIEFNAAHKEFYDILAVHKSKGTDPCSDARLPALLQTAATLHAKIKASVEELAKILQNPLVLKATGMDVIDFIGGATKLADADRVVKSNLDQMNKDWEGLGCGKAPGGKKNLVTIVGKVLDKKGAGISGASVTCGGKSTTTGAGGGFSVVLPLDADDVVEAEAQFTIPAGVSVSNKTSVTYKTGDQLAVLIVLDTSPNRPVTLRGQVLDKNGKPIANATVTALGQTTTTDADGNYTLNGTAEAGKPIPVSVTVTTKGGKSATAGGSVEFKGEDNLTVPAINVAGVELAEAFQINGVVLDANGAGLAGVSISAEGQSATTGSGGSYQLGPFEGATNQQIKIAASFTDQTGKSHSSSVTATYQGGKSVNAPNIVFSEVAKLIEIVINGRVVDSKGTGLPSATVTAKGSSAVTDGNGDFKDLGPISIPSGESVPVEASVVMQNEKTASGGTTVSSKEAGAVFASITIAEAVVETEFTVTGQVIDSKGRGIEGAAVSVGSWAGSTSGGGQFTAGPIKEKYGATVPVKASIVAKDGKTYGASIDLLYQGGKSLSAGVLTISGVELQEAKKVASLSLIPSNAEAGIGQSVTFSAMATFEDKTTADVTTEATWQGGSENSFASQVPGEFTISASYRDKSASATISVKCPEGQKWNAELNKCVESKAPVKCPEEQEWSAELGKCISLNSAVDDATKGEPNLCDKRTLANRWNALASSIAEGSAIRDDFTTKLDRFNKEINNQNSKPCKNNLIANIFVGSQRDLSEYRNLLEQVKATSTDLIMQVGLCPEIVSEFQLQFGTLALPEMLRTHGQFVGEIERGIANMRGQLQRFGCDETEVTEAGTQDPNNTEDPNVTADGGTGGKEICGDGIDNDGDGLQDEDCAGQGGFNIAIYLYDSGSAKDDVFGLAVTGQGNLGNTPAGGARTYPLSLSAGSYVATVTVVLAPDDVGTFTIAVTEGDRVIASQTGGPSQGTVIQVPFTVGQGGTTSAASLQSLPMFDFDQVMIEETPVKSLKHFDMPGQNRQNDWSAE